MQNNHTLKARIHTPTHAQRAQERDGSKRGAGETGETKTARRRWTREGGARTCDKIAGSKREFALFRRFERPAGHKGGVGRELLGEQRVEQRLFLGRARGCRRCARGRALARRCQFGRRHATHVVGRKVAARAACRVDAEPPAGRQRRIEHAEAVADAQRQIVLGLAGKFVRRFALELHSAVVTHVAHLSRRPLSALSSGYSCVCEVHQSFACANHVQGERRKASAVGR